VRYLSLKSGGHSELKGKCRKVEGAWKKYFFKRNLPKFKEVATVVKLEVLVGSCNEFKKLISLPQTN